MITELSTTARKYFQEKGLSYENITSGDICVLVMILNKHLKIAIKENKTPTKMYMSEKIDFKYKPNGTLKEGYLYVNSQYFRQREAISFNSDGFIGFCGWADDRNTPIIVNAFIEWCDTIYH